MVTYTAVRANPETLIQHLTEFEKQYLSMDENVRKAFYLKTREFFNEKVTDMIDSSAMFIFLNKTCFNGLYRVNRKGDFNVPFGNYKNPTICDSKNIRSCSNALSNTTILRADYAETSAYAHHGTLFYLDPPYRPISDTSLFTSYTSGKFGDDDQLKLRKFCQEIHDNGGKFILSNSDAGDGYFDELYKNFTIERVEAKRSINSDGTKRGKINELIIRNF
jgi:DNA adenine methylase